MVRKPLKFVVFLSYILCQSNGGVSAEEFFDVLSVTDVPFPTSAGFAATLKAPYKNENKLGLSWAKLSTVVVGVRKVFGLGCSQG